MDEIDVIKMLCDYGTQLDHAKEQLEAGQVEEATVSMEDIKKSTECEVCHAVLDEVIGATRKLISCQEGCGDIQAEAFERIAWAKDSFCPTASPPED